MLSYMNRTAKGRFIAALSSKPMDSKNCSESLPGLRGEGEGGGGGGGMAFGHIVYFVTMCVHNRASDKTKVLCLTWLRQLEDRLKLWAGSPSSVMLQPTYKIPRMRGNGCLRILRIRFLAALNNRLPRMDGVPENLLGWISCWLFTQTHQHQSTDAVE